MKPTRTYDREVHACTICHAHVHELRRGRCWGCYTRWCEARPVGLGARCTTCGEQRRPLLRSVELFGGWRPMCFNCAGQLARLDPMPGTVLALRTALSRDRRRRDRRAAGTAVAVGDRRIGDRRSFGREAAADDELVIEITVEDASDAVDRGWDELTQIRELVRDLRGGDRA